MTDLSMPFYDLGWGENALVCPHCGGNNLHHAHVMIYDRGDGAGETLVTRAGDGGTLVTSRASEKSGNPSSRRDALSIVFWCENCSIVTDGEFGETGPTSEVVVILDIVQHKGTTYVGWRKK